MNNEQNGPRANSAECQKPLFFAFVNQIALGDCKRIVKNELSQLETDAVLADIRLVLVFAPFEAHSLESIRSVSSVRTFVNTEAYCRAAQKQKGQARGLPF